MIRENRLYEELKIGDNASIKRVCAANDLYVFAHASGNLNPLHLPPDGEGTAEAIAPSICSHSPHEVPRLRRAMRGKTFRSHRRPPTGPGWSKREARLLHPGYGLRALTHCTHR
jgi:hypothetical protein